MIQFSFERVLNRLCDDLEPNLYSGNKLRSGVTHRIQVFLFRDSFDNCTQTWSAVASILHACCIKSPIILILLKPA